MLYALGLFGGVERDRNRIGRIEIVFDENMECIEILFEGQRTPKSSFEDIEIRNYLRRAMRIYFMRIDRRIIWPIG